jgi:hypothetical protein
MEFLHGIFAGYSGYGRRALLENFCFWVGFRMVLASRLMPFHFSDGSLFGVHTRDTVDREGIVLTAE